ncbi:hypothetical protein AK830_g3885 [Neonectria ditissima]|uniref:CFEM domain-containing protein n=1 Tax=Neonectria ditissima TaxID=78410 RepID=A0A0P7BQ31_9HYPO|nr:hypothetical protein AK830_g3885 [Neonectria ditissima]
MRYSCVLSKLVVILVVIAGVYSQPVSSTLDTLPHCALECLTRAIANSSCSAINQTCICTTESLQVDMAVCITDRCTVMESLITKNATLSYCGTPARHNSIDYTAISAAFAIVSGIMVVQRFAFKLHAKLDLGPDDWFTLTAAIASIPLTALAIYGISSNGLGHDIWTLPFSKIYNFGKYFLVMEVIYFAEITLLKSAMLFLYLRIFPSPRVRRLLWGTIVFNIAFGVAFVVVAAFVQCKPVSYFWQMWDDEHEGQCLNQNAIAWSNAAISIALDLWMLAIPLCQIGALHLSWRRKIGVGAMFVVGTFVTIVSILRLRSLVKFGAQSKNPTWEYHDVAVWSTIEINVGIICNCMPSLRLIIPRIFSLPMGPSLGNPAEYERKTPGLESSRGKQSQVTQRLSSASSYIRAKSQVATRDLTFTVEFLENDEAHLIEVWGPDTISKIRQI